MTEINGVFYVKVYGNSLCKGCAFSTTDGCEVRDVRGVGCGANSIWKQMELEDLIAELNKGESNESR